MDQTVSTASVSRGLVRLIRAKPCDRADLEAAALLTLDAVANMLAGRNSGPGRVLLDWAQRFSPSLPAANSVDAGRMALLLGGLCHILEVDDLHRASVVHPGCVVVPAIFALAASGQADARSGQNALTAVLHGFEATTRVGRAVGKAHYRIWHNTATCGPFGSAVAAARLLGLDEDAEVHAMGNAGTQAAGLWQFLDTGAMSKHLHAGRAAEAGLVAAQLAACGFTGAPEIFEGERGFFAAACPDGDLQAILADEDAPWQAHLTSIKPWPSCRHTHPAIDAAGEIRETLKQRAIASEDIANVEVETYQAALDLCDRETVDSTYAAKFSLQHCVAAALNCDRVDFAAFDDDARASLAPERAKVVVLKASRFERGYPAHWGSAVAVTLADGERIEAERSDAKGDPEAPVRERELIDKAMALMDHGGIEEPHHLIDAILRMADDGPMPALPL